MYTYKCTFKYVYKALLSADPTLSFYVVDHFVAEFLLFPPTVS